MHRRTGARGIALLLIGLCIPDNGLAQALWRYTHPESNLILGLEWRRVAGSKLGQELRSTMSQATMPGMPGLAQMNVFDAMDRIILSAPMPPQGMAQAPEKGLLAVEGRFDWATVRASLLGQGARVRMMAGREILVSQRTRGAGGALALAEPGILLIGDLNSVSAALRGVSMPRTSALYRRAASLAATNDIWFAGVVAPGMFPASAAPSARMLSDVTGYDLGLNLRDGMGLELNVVAKSAQSASALAGGLRMMMGMAMQQPNNPEMASLAGKVQVAVEGSRVHMGLHLDEAELERSFRSLRAAMPGGIKRVQVPAASATEETDKPREPQVIRIYGAEGGTREIPVGKP
ncbi:MAG: hypothetical protein LLG20_17940 [Acidobacteriales bacterium]|nr:hypothetical protein [Terriglobales bacterium]